MLPGYQATYVGAYPIEEKWPMLGTAWEPKWQSTVNQNPLGKFTQKREMDANHLCWSATHWQQPWTWCRFGQSCFILLPINGEKRIMFTAFSMSKFIMTNPMQNIINEFDWLCQNDENYHHWCIDLMD